MAVERGRVQRSTTAKIGDRDARIQFQKGSGDLNVAAAGSTVKRSQTFLVLDTVRRGGNGNERKA